MARGHVADGRTWRVAANILDKQLWTTDKGWPPSSGLGKVLTTPPRKNWPCYGTDTLPRARNDPLLQISGSG
jgi:hypothetical protein